ncbi:unnamed protein product [Lactuca saligna]|uniref:DUF4283 domain-containing protein n=1 Tax=Lactuca saligna TaxID=75948 RepID=A0AA35YW93_LACSI|nr:unnamed protein product [Lactuca saligna]
MISSVESRECIHNTLVGEVECFLAFMNVKAFQDVEGCPQIQMRYLGGLKMLLEFDNKKDKEDFLIKGVKIWKPWFKSLSCWQIECNFNERVASIKIQGVPQHAWCEEAFSIIAKNWGTIVIPDECATDSLNLALGRVGIVTSHPGINGTSPTIFVDGRPYLINIMEDIFESLKLNPVLASNDFSSSMAWWNDGVTLLVSKKEVSSDQKKSAHHQSCHKRTPSGTKAGKTKGHMNRNNMPPYLGHNSSQAPPYLEGNIFQPRHNKSIDLNQSPSHSNPHNSSDLSAERRMYSTVHANMDHPPKSNMGSSLAPSVETRCVNMVCRCSTLKDPEPQST